MNRDLDLVDWEYELAYLNSCQSFKRFVAIVADLEKTVSLASNQPLVKPARHGEHVPLGIL